MAPLNIIHNAAPRVGEAWTTTNTTMVVEKDVDMAIQAGSAHRTDAGVYPLL